VIWHMDEPEKKKKNTADKRRGGGGRENVLPGTEIMSLITGPRNWKKKKRKKKRAALLTFGGRACRF